MEIHLTASTTNRRSPSDFKRPATSQRSLANGILGQLRRLPTTVSNTYTRKIVAPVLRPTSRSMAKTRRCRSSNRRCTTLMDAAQRQPQSLNVTKINRSSCMSRTARRMCRWTPRKSTSNDSPEKCLSDAGRR